MSGRIRTRGFRIGASRSVGVDVNNSERQALARRGLQQWIDFHRRINTQQRVGGPERVPSDRPSSSQRCGARAPGAVDGVKLPML